MNFQSRFAVETCDSLLTSLKVPFWFLAIISNALHTESLYKTLENARKIQLKI